MGRNREARRKALSTERESGWERGKTDESAKTILESFSCFLKIILKDVFLESFGRGMKNRILKENGGVRTFKVKFFKNQYFKFKTPLLL